MKKILLILCLLLINITPVLADSNAYLSSLKINGYELTPEFDKYNNTYSVTINKEDTKLDIEYVLDDDTAEIEILDNDLITEDNHTVTINVKNNEEMQTYKIIVNKAEETTVANFKQDNLELTIPKKNNMKLVAMIIISIWLLLVFVLRFILFGKRKKYIK